MKKFDIKKKIQKIRHNHVLLMIICCIVPLALVFMLVYLFGFSRSYLFWVVLLLCPVMHYFMMKDMHNNKKKKKGECL